MKTRSRKRFALFAFSLLLMGGLIVISAGCVWLLEKQRHDALNHQLIEALVQSNYAHAQELVTAGADPNTHIRALPTPGWRKLVAQLLHRSPPPENNSLTG